MPLPRLATYEDEVIKIHKLREENDQMRIRLDTALISHCTHHSDGGGICLDDIKAANAPSPSDIMDDFSAIAK